jgi:predicted ATPase/class 3 adenylate cyclase
MYNPPTATRPTGTVTFLFTDIEGSTKRWEHHAQAMKGAVERHDIILRQAIQTHGGYVFRTEGDAFRAVFTNAPEALEAAIHAQRAIATEPWQTEIAPMRVRMALHSGAVEVRDGDYVGPSLNRMARLLSAAHGGQTLLSLPAEQLVRDSLPPDVALRDMGEHRLKDLIRPEHVFQVVVPGLPSEFPPRITLDAHPNNLPVQPTVFIGREKELAAVCSLLRDTNTRLVTLTGPGGTGKTRLALQAGAEVLNEFRDGVWFVDLAPTTDHKLVISAIAHPLGVREAGGETIADRLKAYLKDKHLLMILDNFEQVSEAALQVSQLLGSCPRLKVLATSRVPLSIRGEKEYPVPPLSVPDVRNLPTLERLTQYEAVRLFIERATDVKPDFQVTNENAPAVAEICARLDGLPLAIELAAARVRMLSPAALLARLSQRLKVLTGGPLDLPARQQTLRNTIEWSYDLLTEGEKQLFRRMAPFSGGRSLEALEAVCNYDGQLGIDVFEGTGSLLSKNLLREVEGSGGEPRFWMLETIHECAREKLEESGESEALGREHALYFLALAEEAEPHLTGAKQIEWLDRLEGEHDNLRAALRWARERRDARDAGDAEAGEMELRLAGALWRFWYVRGYQSEGREQLAAVLSGGHERSGGGSAIAKALSGAGMLAWAQGDFASARSLQEESLAIRRELGDRGGIAWALSNL